MPPIAQTIADELLPLIFRRGQRRLPGTPPLASGDQFEDPTNILAKQHVFAGGGQGVPLGNVLAPAAVGELPPQTVRPGATALGSVTSPPPQQPTSPAPMDLEAPVSHSGQVMDENAIRPARRIETNRQGRPTPNIALQGDEQTLDYQDRLARMPEDKEGGGWWPRIRAAIAGFAAGGPVGAASAFGTRALREHFDPTLGSREYKAEQMGQLAPAVESIRQSRKDRLAERGAEANIDLAKARTDELRNRKDKEKWIIKQDENGVFRPVNQATGLDPDGKPVKGRLASGWELKIDQNNRYVPVNKQTGLDQNGKPVIARSPTGRPEEDVAFSNAQIQQAISEAQAEQRKIDEGIVGVPQVMEITDPLTGERRTVANPKYTYNMTRRRQLDDDIRNWRLKLKSSKGASKPSSSAEDRLNLLFDDEDEP